MEYLLIFDIIGIIAFALSGYILASKANFDILGIILITYVSSFGGGVIRDLLVDRPPFIFQESLPITIVFITITLAYIFKLHHKTHLEHNKIFILSDSIGLSLFAFTGATIALHADFNFGGVVFLSFLTATGGGIVRDIIMNKVPYILSSEFYGTIAFMIGVITWLTATFYVLNPFSTILILIFGLVFRILAISYKWKLPILINK